MNNQSEKQWVKQWPRNLTQGIQISVSTWSVLSLIPRATHTDFPLTHRTGHIKHVIGPAGGKGVSSPWSPQGTSSLSLQKGMNSHTLQFSDSTPRPGACAGTSLLIIQNSVQTGNKCPPKVKHINGGIQLQWNII